MRSPTRSSNEDDVGPVLDGTAAILSRREIFLTVVAAYSLAVGLPLVDLMRQNVAFFIAHSARPRDILLFAVVASAVVPSVLGGVAAVASPNWLRRFIHGLLVVLFFASFTSQVVARLTGSSLSLGWMLTVSLATGAISSIWINRYRMIRNFVALIGLSPPLLILLFLLSPGVRGAMAPDAVSGRPIEVAGSAPVVVLVFDELPIVSLLGPDGEINRERYPNFARLGDVTTLYRNTSTPANSTMEAVPSLLTGQYPRVGGLPIFNHHMENLFTLFGGSHRVVASEPMTQLCPERVCGERSIAPARERLLRIARDAAVVSLHIGLPKGMRDSLPPVDDRWASFGSGEPDRQRFLDDVITPALRSDRIAAFSDFVASIARSENPALYFHHSLLPHRPWQHLPDGSIYTQSEMVPGQTESVWGDDDLLVAQGLQRHLLQAGLVDTLIGQLLDRLEQLGMVDETIMVVTADHGVAFEPGKHMRHLEDITIGSIVAVPLFISIPGAEGSVVDTPIELTDVLPTLADLLDADVDGWSFDGKSVLEEVDGRRLFYARDGASPIEALVTDRDTALHRWDRRVSMGGGWETVFNIGVRPELVGRSISTLDIGPQAPWALVLDETAAFGQVALDSGTIPALVTGRVEDGEIPVGGIDLAIAINGRVAATTRTYDSAGSMFSSLVPATSFVDGENEVVIYYLSTEGTLHPIPVHTGDPEPPATP